MLLSSRRRGGLIKPAVSPSPASAFELQHRPHVLYFLFFSHGQNPGLCIGAGQKSGLCIGHRSVRCERHRLRLRYPSLFSQFTLMCLTKGFRGERRRPGRTLGFRAETYTQSRFLSTTYTQSRFLATGTCHDSATPRADADRTGGRRANASGPTKATQSGRPMHCKAIESRSRTENPNMNWVMGFLPIV